MYKKSELLREKDMPKPMRNFIIFMAVFFVILPVGYAALTHFNVI